MGDVSDKGVPAALFMAVTRTSVRAHATDDRSPASILTRVNEELSSGNPSCMFATIFLCVMDIRSGECRYTNAGHNPPYCVGPRGVETWKGRHGPVLGAATGLTYGEDRRRLSRRDALVVFTDGVTEAVSSEDELLGELRLEARLHQCATAAVQELVDSIVRLVDEFETGREQSDDVTVLALRLNGAEAQRDRRETIVLKNELSELRAIAVAIDNFCQRYDVDTSVNRKLNVVMDDLLANIISHGFDDGQEHTIELTLEMDDVCLIARISDDGVPFDLLAAERPGTSLSLEERDPGGLGIGLIRSLSDELDYERRGNRNVITVVFNLRNA